MSLSDPKIAEELIAQNEQFRHLHQQHIDFENQLKEFESRPYLSTEDELEAKRLKKLKLQGKDQMEKIIREFKKSRTAQGAAT